MNNADVYIVVDFEAFAYAATQRGYADLADIKIFKEVSERHIKDSNKALFIWKDIDWSVENVPAQELDDILVDMDQKDFMVICKYYDGEVKLCGRYTDNPFNVRVFSSVVFDV